MKLSCSRSYINPTPVPKMPTGLVELMEGLSREVIKNDPDDILNFCMEHMNKLLDIRDGRSTKTFLNLEQKINVAKNVIKQRAEQRRANYDKNMKNKQLSTDNKPFEKNKYGNDYHHANKNCNGESNQIQSDENLKINDSNYDNSEINSSQVEMAGESLKGKAMYPTASKYCDIDGTEIESEGSIKEVASVIVLNTQSNTNISPECNKNLDDLTIAEVNNLKDGNKTELSKQEETHDFSNITEEKVKFDVKSNIDLGNKFNHEIYACSNIESKIDTEIDKMDKSVTTKMKTCKEKVEEINENIQSHEVNGEVLDTKKDEYNHTLSVITGNYQNNHNSEGHVIFTKDITKTNTELAFENKEKIIPSTCLNVVAGTETMSNSNGNNEITCSDTKTNKIKTSNMYTLTTNDNEVRDIPTNELTDVNVSEEAPKNDIIEQCNEEVPETIIIEKTDDYVSSEEAPKNNLIQCNEEVSETIITELTDDYVSCERASENNLVEQCNEEVSETIIIEQTDDNVLSEEAPKNNLIVQCNEEVPETIIIERTEDHVLGEAPKDNVIVQCNEKVPETIIIERTEDHVLGEAPKDNVIVQCNEKVPEAIITERTDDYVSSEVAPKINLILQRETENFEEENLENGLQQKEFKIMKGNEIKFDSLSTNTNSDIKEEKTGIPIDISGQNVQNIVSDFGSGNINNDEQAVVTLENHGRNVITCNKQLNEYKTTALNTKEEFKNVPLIENIESEVDSSIKKGYSKNNFHLEDFRTNECNDNTKQEFDRTDTNNVNPMDLERAAITIQKVFRNFLFRSKTSSFDDMVNTEDGLERDVEIKNLGTFENHNQNLNKERRAVGINRMDTVLQTVNEEKSLSLSTDDSSTISSAATVIQAHIRGFLVRNRLNHDKTVSNASLADCDDPPATSHEGDLNKNKTVLNIHIVPEGSQFISRDESLLTSVELSLDGSPPTSANLHPLGYDKNERRKQLKREDAIQSISPPSNNSRLSEEHDSVKELSTNDKKTQKEQTVSVEEHVDSHLNKVTSADNNESKKEEDLKEPYENKDSESVVCKASDNCTDESDVVTPFKSTEVKDSNTNNKKLLHSGEFHDLVLPTKVSRSDTEVVSGE